MQSIFTSFCPSAGPFKSLLGMFTACRVFDTIVKAHGAGSSGKVSDKLDVDTNIKFHVIVPQGRMSDMLDDVELLLNSGEHLTVFVSDVAVMGPEKFEQPLTESTA